MNVYVVTAISGIVIICIAFLFSKFKKITFAEYSKKFDDL